MNMKPRTLMLYGFLFVAISAAVMLFYIMWTVDQRLEEVQANPDIISDLALMSIALLFGILGGTFMIIERFFVQPYYNLSRQVENFVLSGTAEDFKVDRRNALGKLPLRIQALAEAQIDARQAREAAVEKATRSLAEQKSHLEAVLADLHEGVVICNLNHQIILYNKKALELLHVSGDLGLGRSLFSVMNRQPFLHALERLTNRLGEGRHEGHKHGLSTQFIASTTDGHNTFEGRISLITDDDDLPTAYIATFEDNTKEIAALATRDRLLRNATEGLRQPVANIRVATEALTMNSEMPDGSRRAFIDMISAEVTGLSETLEDLAGSYRDVITGSWPMADIYSANLLNCVVRRLREEKDISAVMTGIPDWLHGDSYTLVEILDFLVHKIHTETGASDFDIETDATSDRHVNLDIIWTGELIPAGDLDRWLKQPLTNTVGGMTGREILDHHKTDIWSQPHGQGRAHLRIPLLHAEEPPEGSTKTDIPSRPEFYDFGLSQAPTVIADTPLKELSFVVFDTETTGLKPSEGDKIISIAGVRVVNGRILTGEVFSELVHPGRKIPKESIQFHGITDEMVTDKPPIEEVLPRFKDYVQDTVLVAHNAAFDMKFLKIYQKSADVSFDNSVMCTMLLSKYLHSHTEAHSIDDLCDRFGLTVDGRHTALGDALVTAAILVKLIELLEEEGIETLNQAINAANKVAEIRVMEAQF